MKQTFDLFATESTTGDERDDGHGDEGASLVNGSVASGVEITLTEGQPLLGDGNYVSDPATPLPPSRTVLRHSS